MQNSFVIIIDPMIRGLRLFQVVEQSTLRILVIIIDPMIRGLRHFRARPLLIRQVYGVIIIDPMIRGLRRDRAWGQTRQAHSGDNHWPDDKGIKTLAGVKSPAFCFIGDNHWPDDKGIKTKLKTFLRFSPWLVIIIDPMIRGLRQLYCLGLLYPLNCVIIIDPMIRGLRQ